MVHPLTSKFTNGSIVYKTGQRGLLTQSKLSILRATHPKNLKVNFNLTKTFTTKTLTNLAKGVL